METVRHFFKRAMQIVLVIIITILVVAILVLIRAATAPVPTSALIEQTKALPAWKIDENLAGYEELAKRDPENELYQAKVDHYRAKVQERDREADAERERREEIRRAKAAEAQAEAARRASVHGEEPLAWPNGKVPIVDSYIKSIAKDPGSVEYFDWGPVIYGEGYGWMVKCDWGARNSFGGMVRRTDLFIISKSRVIDVLQQP